MPRLLGVQQFRSARWTSPFRLESMFSMPKSSHLRRQPAVTANLSGQRVMPPTATARQAAPASASIRVEGLRTERLAHGRNRMPSQLAGGFRYIGVAARGGRTRITRSSAVASRCLVSSWDPCSAQIRRCVGIWVGS